MEGRVTNYWVEGCSRSSALHFPSMWSSGVQVLQAFPGLLRFLTHFSWLSELPVLKGKQAPLPSVSLTQIPVHVVFNGLASVGFL
jgi:hypothetical protein